MSNALDDQLCEFVVGNDFDIVRTIDMSGLFAGATLTKAWFFVKKTRRDPDAAAIIQLDITSIYAAGKGQITDTGAGDLKAQVVFEVDANVSANLVAGRVYFYDIKVLTSTGQLSTPESGTCKGRGAIKVASS
jgi:hypothetical protein